MQLRVLCTGVSDGKEKDKGDSTGHETQAEPEEVEEESKEEESKLSLGDFYLRGVLGACLLLWAVKHNWLLFLFIGPLFYAITKKIGLAQLASLSTLSLCVCVEVSFKCVEVSVF